MLHVFHSEHFPGVLKYSEYISSMFGVLNVHDTRNEAVDLPLNMLYSADKMALKLQNLAPVE